MAIAFDATTESSVSGSSHTYSHTCTGSDLNLVIGFTVYGGSTDRVTSVTYNGVSATRINSSVEPLGGAVSYLYLLTAPATGANNVVITLNQSELIQSSASSYTGTLQSSQPDQNDTHSVNGASTTTSITTTTDDDWLVGYANNVSGRTYSAGSNTEYRSAVNNYGAFDSNADQSPAGSFSCTLTLSSAGRSSMCLMGLKPAAGGGGQNSSFLKFM